jgi:hypothetical protein
VIPGNSLHKIGDGMHEIGEGITSLATGIAELISIISGWRAAWSGRKTISGPPAAAVSMEGGNLIRPLRPDSVGTNSRAGVR